MVRIGQLLKCMDKDWSGNSKLFQSLFDGLRQDTFSLSRQPHEDVRSRAGPLHQIIRLGAIDEFDGAVVMTSELLCKGADIWFDAFLKASDCKQ
jgi:hypothetical protein